MVARFASRIGLILAVFLACSTTAKAAWLEASSPNFVVYAEQSEKQVRAFSDMLERYRSGDARGLQAAR